MVSMSQMIMMVISMIAGICIPIILAIVCKKKYQTSMIVFWIGCAVWFVFTQILEKIMHVAVLSSPAGRTIQENIVFYGIYGGLAAGVFEEVGRFLSMKFVLKKYYDNPHNALMYGAGHGGFEAAYILGIAGINNLIYSVMINTNQTTVILSNLPTEQQEIVGQAFEQLIATPAYMFGIGIFERFSAVLLHIALSVLVWIAVTKGKKILFPLAILVHALVDALTVIINGFGANMFVVELFILVMAGGASYIAWKCWKLHEMGNC